MTHPRRGLRRAVALPALLALLFLAIPAAVAAAEQRTECGLFIEYTPPDPLGPTDGSLALGRLPSWVVAADAEIVTPVETLLPTQVSGGGTTCVTIDFDDANVITRLAMASSGTVEGPVEFDAGADGYWFDDRIIVPAFIIDGFPGLGALFVTSAAAETDLEITFTADPSTGSFAGLVGTARFCGSGRMDGDDGVIGEAVIDGAFLDEPDRRALRRADGRSACATITTSGTIAAGTGELTLATDVDIDVAEPTAPPTSIKDAEAPIAPDSGTIGLLVALLAVLGALLLVADPSRGRREAGR